MINNITNNNCFSRTKRLTKELLEIQRCPVANVCIEPLNQEKLDEWHGNIKGDDSNQFRNIVVHFIVLFPSGYPRFPPRIKLSSYIPHMNVIEKDGGWEICLDMIEMQPIGSATLPYQYWTSAFSVRSILVQMTSFLLSDDQPSEWGVGNIDRTITESSQFTCTIPGCTHSPSNISPSFPTYDDVNSAPLCFPIVEVNGEDGKDLRARFLRRRKEQQQRLMQAELKATASQKEDIETSQKEQEWVAVKGRGKMFNSVPQSKLYYCNDNYISCTASNKFAPLSRGHKDRASKNGITASSFSTSDVMTKGKAFIAKSKAKDVAVDSHQHQQSYTNDWKSDWRLSALGDVTERNMGLFARLNRDVAACIMMYLSVTDVVALGSACRGVHEMSEDWVVWKHLFRTRYGRSALLPSGANASWHHAYVLEANCLPDEMHCFFSRLTRAEDVLGMPVEYTVNSTTKHLEYATSNFDVLSLSAYREVGVRKTVWGEKFSTLIPYYIDQSHFDKGLPQLRKVAIDLIGPTAVTPKESEEAEAAYIAIQDAQPDQSTCSSSGMDALEKVKVITKEKECEGGRWKKMDINDSTIEKKVDNTTKSGGKLNAKPIKPWLPVNEPEMILTLLTKMMNTQVVLLCDKGVQACDTVLVGYCQLHRLLIAVVDTYPQLQLLIRKRLRDFINCPASRVKGRTPSLGFLILYLSVSDMYSWTDISFSYLLESFDRSILWVCAEDPTLAKVVAGDASRLDKYMKYRKVAMRLSLFHICFVNLLVQGGGSKVRICDCKDRYDRFQGRPPLHLRRQFQQSVKDILSLESWPQFFSIAKVPLPNKMQLLTILEQAVMGSLRKGYHSHDTVFERVKSKVSKLMLKGESYSTSPTLKRIRVLEKWKYTGNDVNYLDASCLVYGFRSERLGIVDYVHTSWKGCIEHSGDVLMDGVGQHSIDINISRLSSCTNVKAIFFTVSGWTTSLKSISQPSCHVHDADNDVEMCRYKLEGSDTGDKTAVIMCKLHRFSPSARWEFTSIGHVGYGRADNYTSIEQAIGSF